MTNLLCIVISVQEQIQKMEKKKNNNNQNEMAKKAKSEAGDNLKQQLESN